MNKKNDIYNFRLSFQGAMTLLSGELWLSNKTCIVVNLYRFISGAFGGCARRLSLPQHSGTGKVQFEVNYFFIL